MSQPRKKPSQDPTRRIDRIYQGPTMRPVREREEDDKSEPPKQDKSQDEPSKEG